MNKKDNKENVTRNYICGQKKIGDKEEEGDYE
jgi:hypothetical protein